MPRSKAEMNILNNTSFLDAMANSVGALAFMLLMVVIVTVALKLNYFDLRIETPMELPDAIVGEPYEMVLAGFGGNEPYSWGRIGDLPEGLRLDERFDIGDGEGISHRLSVPGRIFGIPLRPTAEPVTFTVELDDTAVSDPERGTIIADKPPTRRVFKLQVRPKPFIPPPLRITTKELPLAILGADYAVELAAVGGKPPYLWEASRAGDPIPTWLHLNESSGTIGARPSKEGKWPLHVTVKDKDDSHAEATLVFEASELKRESDVIDGVVKKLKIETTTLPPAIAGRPYELKLAASGGIPPLRWSMLPGHDAWFSVTEDGRLVGTPKQVDEGVPFTVQVTSDPGAPKPDTDSRALTLRVDRAPAEIPALEIP